jgi:hypothetical protein
VVLTNPDGRLRFPAAADTTRSLTLAAGGAWSDFEISGETISAGVGDAHIEAHLDSAGGRIVRRRDVTVVSVEIQINNTATADDDVVQLKCEHPAHRTRVASRARVVPGAPGAVNVVLTNPDGRLRFPGSADTTVNLALPANGAFVAFNITGETVSTAIGDAKIEAHVGAAAGPIAGRRDVSVFGFDPASMVLTMGGNYAIVAGNYTVAGGVAVSFSSTATLKPAGLNCAAAQIARLRIAIMQESSNFVITTTWNTPVIAWAPGVAPGTAVAVPTTMRQQTNYAAGVVQPVNDGLAGASPLYEMSPTAMRRPVGCAGGGAATSSDTPGQGVPPTFSQPVTAGGVVVGTVTWTVLVNTTRREDFRTFCVVFDTVSTHFCALRQARWSLAADSAGAGPQRATVHGDAAATVTPATGVQANVAPSTTTNAGVGGATTPFVHP